MYSSLKNVLALFVDAWRIWSHSRASRMAAALTYYTLLSLAPLLVVAVAIAGVIYGPSVARSEIIEQIQKVASEQVAETVRQIALNASNPESGLVAGGLSLLVLLFGASGVFSQLFDTFNVIWEVPFSERSGWWYTLRQRLSGFIMVLSIGFLLLLSLVFSAILAYVNAFILDRVSFSALVLPAVDTSISIVLVGGLFAILFKALPKADVAWRDVWLAGLVTAVLFDVAKYLIRIYVGRSSVVPLYGAASAIVILLIWIYFLSQILFYGGALAKAYADRFGSLKREKVHNTFEALASIPLERRYRRQEYPLASIVALIKNPEDNRFLLIRRIKPPYRDKWALVGGKWDFGETLATCALREVAEETGLTAEFVALRGIMMERLAAGETDEDAGHFLLFVCALTHVDGEAQERHEGTVAWFSPAELERLHARDHIIPSDYLLLKKFGRSDASLPYIEADLLAGEKPTLKRFVEHQGPQRNEQSQVSI